MITRRAVVAGMAILPAAIPAAGADPVEAAPAPLPPSMTDDLAASFDELQKGIEHARQFIDNIRSIEQDAALSGYERSRQLYLNSYELSCITSAIHAYGNEQRQHAHRLHVHVWEQEAGRTVS